MRKPPVLTTLFLGTTVLLTGRRDVVPGLVPALRRDRPHSCPDRCGGCCHRCWRRPTPWA